MEKHGWYFIMIMKETTNVEHLVEVANLLGSLTVKSSLTLTSLQSVCHTVLGSFLYKEDMCFICAEAVLHKK